MSAEDISAEVGNRRASDGGSTSRGWRRIMPSWSSKCRLVFLLGKEGMAVWGERCIVRSVEGGEGWVKTKRSSPAEAVIINC